MAWRVNLNTYLVMSLLLLSMAGLTQGRIITVDDDGPADFNNIQAAINDANDWDTVLVADGIYTGPGNRDIDFMGKAITLKSENGPENCAVDCNGTQEYPHRGFYFHSGEDPNSIVSGFTITNGYLYENDGAGIYLYESSPTLDNCVITNNEVKAPFGPGGDVHGGGIYCGPNSSPTIINCIISDNIISFNIGGWSIGYGAGIYCSSTSDPTILICTISRNRDSAAYSGGIYNDGGDLTLTKCVFTGNIIGMLSVDGSLILNQCRFNCNFGAMGIECNGKARLSNCTFADNFYGIGLSKYFYSEATLTNCILWGNPPSEIYVGQGTVLATYSNIKGGWPGQGNTNADPCFAQPGAYDPNGTPGDPSDDFWIEGDYHLKSQAGRWDPNSESWVLDEVTSPCIDAGNPADPVGQEPFPNGGRINMGAYGGTAEASKSYFGNPICDTVIAGDINGDCKVDFLDFALMVFHWLEER